MIRLEHGLEDTSDGEGLCIEGEQGMMRIDMVLTYTSLAGKVPCMLGGVPVPYEQGLLAHPTVTWCCMR